MKTPAIQVSVEQGDDMEPVIQIADQSQKLIMLNLEAAHRLLEDLFVSIELVESLMPGQKDVTH